MHENLLLHEMALYMLMDMHTNENVILAIPWKIIGGTIKQVIKCASYHGCDAIIHFPIAEVCTYIKYA